MKIKFITSIVCIIVLSTNIATAGKTTSKEVPSRKASIIVDLSDGKVLHSHNAREPRYIASLVKMMTIYLAFQQIKEGKLSLNKKLPVSSRAASMQRTNLSLKKGDHISVHEAILGLIIHSSNDTAVVLAEAIAGSEAKFANMMNAQAKKLKMKKTTYRNASGLPHKEQKSTVVDLAKLARALKKDFPSFFSWFSKTSFSFNGKTYNSHNNIVRNNKWATGLKTGFTNASGFTIVTTAHKDGKDLVGIVLGENTAKSRDKLMTSLLNKHFKNPDPKIKIASLSKKAMQNTKKSSNNQKKKKKKSNKNTVRKS